MKKCQVEDGTDQNGVLLTVVGSNILVLHGSCKQTCSIDSQGLLSLPSPFKQALYNALLQNTHTHKFTNLQERHVHGGLIEDLVTFLNLFKLNNKDKVFLTLHLSQWERAYKLMHTNQDAVTVRGSNSGLIARAS